MTDIETVDLVETWLFDVLENDATLSGLVGGRVVGTLMPLGGLVLPCAMFSLSSTRDITNASGHVIDTESLYMVKAVIAGSSWDPAKPIARRIHELINGKVYTFGSGADLTCVRDRILERTEEDHGQQYRHLGGIYRIRASTNL